MIKKAVLPACILISSLILGGLWQSEVIYAHAGHTHTISEVIAQTTEVPTQDPSIQTATDSGVSQEIILPVDTIFIKPQQPEHIKALLKLYQDQVEKYAASEREYRTAKAQFFKLQTLQSLEEAITKTRQAMVDRDAVLITYTELVRAYLQETDGIEISLKTYSDTDLEKLIIFLKDHKEKVTQTKDREALKQRAAEFLPITESINGRLSLAVALISLGDLQTIYDKNKILYREIKQLHTDTVTTALRQEERERAYREIDKAIEDVRVDIEALRLDIGELKGEESNFTPTYRPQFQTVATGNQKVLDYLQELLLELT